MCASPPLNQPGPDHFRTKTEVRQLVETVAGLLASRLTGAVRLRCKGTQLMSDVDDITQEAFRRFQEALSRGEMPEITVVTISQDDHQVRIRQWLFTTVHHIIRESFRALRKRPVTNRETLEEQPAPSSSAPIALEDIEAAIAQCSSEQGVAFHLRHAGWTYAEISRRLDISENAAKGRYHRAKHRLRKLLIPLL